MWLLNAECVAGLLTDRLNPSSTMVLSSVGLMLKVRMASASSLHTVVFDT